MMLRGIDVSSWDGWAGGFTRGSTETAYQESDFMIAKATQGTGYVNPHCDAAIQRARADGKLWGFYHYASGGDPVEEADYFYEHTSGYFGEGIPCLDWESGQNSSWGSDSWCREFADRIHELTGVWCMVYIQASALGQAASCASDCALWVAGYPDERDSWDLPSFRYDTSPWSTWTLWQYTSSGGATDRNYAQLDSDGWLAIAEGEETVKQEDIDAIVEAVIERLPLAVWNYHNDDVNEGRDSYELLTENNKALVMRDDTPYSGAAGFGYRNPEMFGDRDLCQVTKDIEDRQKAQGEVLEAIIAKLGIDAPEKPE